MLDSPTLRAGSVRYTGATASAIGIQAPTAGVTFLPALMAAIVGESGPLAFLLALFAMLLVSYAFIVLAADFASAGSVFAFNGRALGYGYGFISAWMLLGVYIAYSSSIYASNANFLESLAKSAHVAIAWPVFALLFWALALVLAYRRISLSTLLIFVLEGVAIVLVAIVAVVVLLKGGSGGHAVSAAPFTLNSLPVATLGLGVIFAFTGFSGFEVAATLGEETLRPRRVIPVSMIAALLVSGAIYVVLSWVETIAYPSATALASQPVPLVDIAGRYVSPAMGTIINVAALISGIGAQLATVNGANRLLYALGRDGFGPRWLSKVNRRERSPVGALAVVGVVSLLAVVPFMLNGTAAIDAFFYLATYGADLIIIAYLLTAIAALAWSIRRGRASVVRVAGLLAAIVVMAYIIKGTVYPIPAAPFDLCIYAAGITIAVGVVLLLTPRLRANLSGSTLFAAARQTEVDDARRASDFMPLRERIEAAAVAYRNQECLVLPDATLSFGEVDRLANATANALLARGVREGSVVMTLCHNGSAQVATWFACMKIGAVFAPLNASLTGDPLLHVIISAGGSMLICDGALARPVRTALHAIPNPPVTLATGTDIASGFASFDAAVAAASTDPPPSPALDPAAPARLMFTSGTTGESKGVLWSRNAEMLHAVSYGDELVRVDRGETVYTCLPLFHVTAQGTLLGTMLRGGRTVVDQRFEPLRFWARNRSVGAVFFPYVGTIISTLMSRAPRRNDADNPVARAMGSATPAGLWQAFERRFGVTLEDVWGQTETASCWTHAGLSGPVPGTVGVPCDRFEARILAGSGVEAAAGQPGELVIRPFEQHVIFEGYADTGTSTLDVTGDGWYRTGDLLSRGADGVLSFHGRLREAIRRRGETIAPVEIEAVALQHSAVREAAAVGVPADDGVEDEILLCVVLSETSSVTPTALHAHLSRELPRFMVPRFIRVEDELPKTATTRIRRVALRGPAAPEPGTRGCAATMAEPTPRRVVVTGMGTVSPVGNDVTESWEALKAGRSGTAPITHFDASRLPVRIAGEVKGFDAAAIFGNKEARRGTPHVQFAMAAAREAVQHSGLDIAGESTDVGVLIASGIGGLEVIENTTRVLDVEGARRVSPFAAAMALVDMAPGMVSIDLGARGPNMAVVSACASGADAIGQAANWIRQRDAVAVLAGGTEAGITSTGIAMFAAARALSTRNDDAAHASRPFERDRDGFVAAEGSAVLVLEEREHALARGAIIYAELLGYAASADAYHITAPEPSGDGAVRCVRRALERAGKRPKDIEYINAHGTGTPLNDLAETRALKQVFGDFAYKVPISSTKSMTGHMLGAAGAFEAMVTILAMRDGFLPPTVNLDNADPECDLDYVPNTGRAVGARVAMTTSFGFGGHNACLVFAGEPDPA